MVPWYHWYVLSNLGTRVRVPWYVLEYTCTRYQWYSSTYHGSTRVRVPWYGVTYSRVHVRTYVLGTYVRVRTRVQTVVATGSSGLYGIRGLFLKEQVSTKRNSRHGCLGVMPAEPATTWLPKYLPVRTPTAWLCLPLAPS
jgi:hypothetical protein